MLALLLLNDQLPLCMRGEVITPDSFTTDVERGIQWLEGDLPERLAQLGREGWLSELAERRRRALALARDRKIPFDRERFAAVALIADRSKLESEWRKRRMSWPESSNGGLTFLASKVTTDEELVLLVCAPLRLFRPADDILAEADEAANEAGTLEFWDREIARQRFLTSRREIFLELSDRLTDFVRSGNARIDEWADLFRFENRITLARALVLLSIPIERWRRPEGAVHWRLLFTFFQKKVLASIQRGPLLSLRVARNSQKIDITELDTQAVPTAELLDHIVSQAPNLRQVDPSLIADNSILAGRIRRLRNSAENYLRETGIASLYLGYPLLIRRESNQSTPKVMPLFLWPLGLDYPEGRRRTLRLGFDAEQDGWRLNPALEASIPLEEHRRLKEIMQDLNSRGSLTADQVMESLDLLYDVSFTLSAVPTNPHLSLEARSRALKSGVLFQCDFAAQTLANELKQLSDRANFQSPLAKLLRLTEMKGESNSEKEYRLEGEKPEGYLVTDCDPSQEAAVSASRERPGLLIQGPPGTGKSQTIVNIVADIVGRGGRVLVVCQKQAALEVVKNRLEGAGLGQRAALIGDHSRDRRPFLTDLRFELDGRSEQANWTDAKKEYSLEAAGVVKLEEEIDQVYQASRRPIQQSGLCYEEIIAHLVVLQKNEHLVSVISLRPLLGKLSYTEVIQIARGLEQVAGLWFQANYEESPFALLKPFSPDADTVSDFWEHLAQFADHEERRIGEGTLLVAPFDLDPEDAEAWLKWLTEFEDIRPTIDDHVFGVMKKWSSVLELNVSQQVQKDLQQIIYRAQEHASQSVSIPMQTDLTALADDKIWKLSRQTASYLRWNKSWMRHFWPSYRATKRALIHEFPEVYEQGLEALRDLHDAIHRERQHRIDFQTFRECHRNLSIQVSDSRPLPLELHRRSRKLLDAMQQGRKLLQLADTCPDRDQFLRVLKTGDISRTNQFCKSAREGIQLLGLKQKSLAAVGLLSPWVSEQFTSELRATIRSNGTNSSIISGLISAKPSLIPYQTIRLRMPALDPIVTQTLAALATQRSRLARLPAESIAHSIANIVRREALLTWKSAAEMDFPGLLIPRPEFELTDAFILEASAWCAAEAERIDVEATHDSILLVLRELGYDVREGMGTAWAEDGKLVVQQPGSGGYGVQLSTLPNERVKTELVRFSDTGHASHGQEKRDLEVETEWCATHAKILEQLAGKGVDGSILTARPVGSTPVKVLPAQSGAERGRERTAPDRLKGKEL